MAAFIPSVALADGDGVLYSDSFNGYPTSAKTADGTVFAAQADSNYDGVKDNADWQWMFNSPASRTLDKLTVGFSSASADDTAVIMINEKEATDKYLVMPRNRFSSRGIGQITGLDSYTANSGESLVIDFKVMLEDGVLAEGGTASALLDLGDLGVLTPAELGTGEWKEVKLVTYDGSTSIYVDGSAVGDPVSAVPSIIRPVQFEANTKCNAYPSVCIDDIVILSSADGVDAVVPAAADHELTEEEPEETEPPKAVPGFTAHSTAQNLMSQDFNEIATGSLISIGTAAQEPNTSIPGLEFRVGYRDKGADSSSYASISSLTEGDNVVKIAGGKFASNGRGVRMALADDLSIAENTDLTSIMAFAFKVEPLQDGGKGQLYLLDNDTNVDGNSVARDILAVFTSNGDSDNYKNGDTKIGIDVTAGEWHVARIAVSNGSYRVYLDNNADDPAVKATKVNTGATSKAVTNLPIIVATNGKSGSENYSLVTIDNVMAYQISAPFEKKYLPTVSGSEDNPPATASPEPASGVEGSGIDLLPSGGRDVTDAFAAVEGVSEEVLNHSYAKPAAEGAIDAYHEKQKGNSTYVAYDVLVNAGDKLSLAEKNGTTLGATFVIAGNEDGTATASYIDQGGNKGGKLSGSLVCGTWYRVVIETPISSDGKCGKSVYTVYRIDPEDPSQTLEVAAKAKDISARNLYDRGLTTIEVTKEGAPYTDNGVVYINPNSADTAIIWYKYSFTKDGNGVLTSVTVTTVADPASETLGTNEYLWDQNQKPYTE